MVGRLDNIAADGRGTARHGRGARVEGGAVVGGHDMGGNMTSGPMVGDEDARLHYVYDAWNHMTAGCADDGRQQGASRLACVRAAVHGARRAPAPRVARAAGAHAIRREAINDRWLPGTSPEFPTARKLFTSPFHSPRGVRVLAYVGEVVTGYVIDERNPTGYAKPIEEYEGGAVSRAYVLGHDIIAQASIDALGGMEVAYLLKDGHGSTRALVDESGAMMAGQSFDFDAFGDPVGDFAPLTDWLAPDGRTDGETGFTYSLARYRDGWRFISEDDPAYGSADEPVSLHKYLYANANPVMGIDPTGCFEWTDVAVEVGATIATMGIAYAFAAPALGWAVVFSGVLGGMINACEQSQNSGLSGGTAFGIGFVSGLATGFLGLTVNSAVGGAAGEAILDTGNWLLDSRTHVDFTSRETWESIMTIAGKSAVAGLLGWGGDLAHADEAILKWFFSFAAQAVVNDFADFINWYRGIKT